MGLFLPAVLHECLLVSLAREVVLVVGPGLVFHSGGHPIRLLSNVIRRLSSRLPFVSALGPLELYPVLLQKIEPFLQIIDIPDVPIGFNGGPRVVFPKTVGLCLILIPKLLLQIEVSGQSVVLLPVLQYVNLVLKIFHCPLQFVVLVLILRQLLVLGFHLLGQLADLLDILTQAGVLLREDPLSIVPVAIAVLLVPHKPLPQMLVYEPLQHRYLPVLNHQLLLACL